MLVVLVWSDLSALPKGEVEPSLLVSGSSRPKHCDVPRWSLAHKTATAAITVRTAVLVVDEDANTAFPGMDGRD